MVHVVRRVPLDWQHPIDEDGDLIPLYGVSLAQAHEAIESLKERYPEEDFDAIYEDLSEEDCFPEWPADAVMGHCLYEIVTEGRPVSPVYETLDELTEWVRLNFKDEVLTHDDAAEWIECFGHNQDTFVLRGDDNE